MSFWSAYFEGWKKGFNFTGKATRKEFWVFAGVNYSLWFLIPISTGIFSGITGTSLPLFYLGIFSTAISLILIGPMAAVGIRRMHDINRSGWWFGIAYLLPLLNKLLNFILVVYASPIVYVNMKLFLSFTLFWIPVIFVIALCCFKSKV